MKILGQPSPWILNAELANTSFLGSSLALDFIGDAYSVGEIRRRPEYEPFADIITLTRASGGGINNSAGNYEFLGNDVPRLDYDPVTLQPRGLLIEEQRTNLLTYSSEFDSGTWAKTQATIGPDATISPDGMVSADSIVEPSTGSVSPRISKGTTLVSATHVYTFYGKAGLRGWIRATVTNGTNGNDLWFDVVTGAVGITTSTTGGLGGVGSIMPAGNGWFRCTIIFTATAGNIFTNIAAADTNGGIFYTPAGGAAIYIWGAQLEASSFPTSYIPTTTAQVTRAADVASVNTLSPWYNATAGNWQVRAQGNVGLPLLTAGTAVITADDAGIKDYELAYTTDQSATSVSIGTGHIESIKYYPRAVV